MIKRFKELSGLYIEKIYGQDRFAFAMSDTSDLYDLVEYAQRGGYQGSVIKFYDFVNGNVYAGNLLSEEIGSLYQAADGTYWMA